MLLLIDRYVSRLFCRRKPIEVGNRLALVLAGTNTHTQQVFTGHESSGLVGVISNLMQGDELVGEGSPGVLVYIFILEADGVVEIGPLGQLMMMAQ